MLYATEFGIYFVDFKVDKYHEYWGERKIEWYGC